MDLGLTSLVWLFDLLRGYAVQASSSDLVFGIDMSIEGLKSQRYSVGIFGFLVVSLIFFSAIIYFYIPRRDSGHPLKTGEKIMFGAIMFGVVIAVVVGWLQLIDGYLF